MQRLIIAMDTTASMDELIPNSLQKRKEWAISLVLDTIKSLPIDTQITLFLLTGNGYQPCMIADYPNTIEAAKQISSLSLPLEADTISFWQDLKNIGLKQFHGIPWNLLCVTDGDDLKYDDHADEFFEEMGRVYPQTSISILDLQGGFHRSIHSKGKELPKTAEVYSIADTDKLVDTIQKKYGQQSNASHQNNPLPLNISTAILPLIPVQKDEYDVVIKCLQRAIPYLEQVTGLRYYPVTTWLVNTSQMELLRSPEVKPKGMSRSDASKKFQALFTIIHSFSLNFHATQKGTRFNEDNYRRYAKQPDIIREFRIAAECIGLVFNKVTGVNLAEIDRNFRICGFSDSLNPVENLNICLHEMARIWRAIASEKPDAIVRFDRLYLPIDCDQKNITIPYFEFLPTQIQELVEELLHDGCWNGLLMNICNLFDEAIIEWIPLLYRLSRTSSEEGDATFTIRFAGLFIPEDNPKSEQLVDIATASGYPGIFRPGAGGNVVVDLEGLKENSVDAIHFEKSLTSLLIHEHSHAIFAEGVNWKHEVGRINHTTDASTVNESLAAWMEVNYWRHDQEMSIQTWNFVYMGGFPQWKYAGAVSVESRFINKGKRGVQALMISLRKGSENIIKLLQEY